MITLASFSKPEDAHLLRMRLEASGIPAFVQDEHIVQTQWLFSNAVGGVRVQVPDEHHEEAQKLLREEWVVLEEIGELVPLRCPSCDSRRTELYELPRRLTFLSILFLQFPLWLGSRRCRCLECGHLWKLRDRWF